MVTPKVIVSKLVVLVLIVIGATLCTSSTFASDKSGGGSSGSGSGRSNNNSSNSTYSSPTYSKSYSETKSSAKGYSDMAKSMGRGNVQALLALFFIIKKCQYPWLNQSKRNDTDGSNPLSIKR